MARKPILSFDRGTLILHPPPRGKDWVDFVTWDDRIEKFRIPAIQYRALVQSLNQGAATYSDKARNYQTLELSAAKLRSPYPHQSEALTAWKTAGGQGVVVLPTAAGKTHLAL
ncbi:MAG: ATP-dependent helicase, partial [Cyanobacteria bacterium P01_F01_bin.42]